MTTPYPTSLLTDDPLTRAMMLVEGMNFFISKIDPYEEISGMDLDRTLSLLSESLTVLSQRLHEIEGSVK